MLGFNNYSGIHPVNYLVLRIDAAPGIELRNELGDSETERTKNGTG